MSARLMMLEDMVNLKIYDVVLAKTPRVDISVWKGETVVA